MANTAFGDITLARVIESEEKLLKWSEVFPDATAEIIRANHDWLVPKHYDPATGGLAITIQSYLIKTRRHTILVDACGGNDKTRARPHFHQQHHPWLETLRANGAAREQIDFVLCTHLHVDHVGWNTMMKDGRWVPTFPNARYLFARAELAHWEAEAKRTGLPRTGDYVADSVLPIVEANRHVLVDMDHAIEDDVVLYPLAGHTPGQVGLHVRGGGREAIICGDMMHHALQCRYPDWSTNFCTDPAHARRTRRAFLERYADTPTLVYPAHFPSPSGGRIERAGADSYRFRFLEH
ncbi:MAG: MBL fold metallo-hydrolase [Alphaproteobacteria bacterium]|nr:MBL fold metallo-hydrolase [Alphaproteobacteria bacterium]